MEDKNSPVSLPKNLDAEIALLGALIIDGHALNDILDKITPEDFYKTAHQNIFRAILALNKENQPIDLIALSERLKKEGKLKSIGEVTYLTSLAQSVPTSANIETHAKIIKEKANLRKLIKISYDVIEKINREDYGDILDDTNQAISDLIKNSFNNSLLGIELPSDPVSLANFLKMDIKSIDYYLEPMLPKKGKLIISGAQGTCKSFMCMNLALALAEGRNSYLKMPIKQAKALYMAGEGGEADMFQRFTTMGISENVYVKYTPEIDLFNNVYQKLIRQWIKDLGINIVIFDPISQFWTGEEKDKSDLIQLTKYIDSLLSDYDVSVILTHHWKKPTKDMKSGLMMASGSYWWNAWCDGHITLMGTPASLIVSFEKARSAACPDPLIAKLNPDTLFLEFVTDFKIKVTEEDLEELFNQFGQDEVSLNAFVNLAKKKNKGCRTTLWRRLNESKVLEKFKKGKRVYIRRKDI